MTFLEELLTSKVSDIDTLGSKNSNHTVKYRQRIRDDIQRLSEK